MTLPNESVIELLRDQFIVGWSNIQRECHVGLSHGYRKDQTAIGTTNGAGGRNVQLAVMAPDETVLHVMPGFWHPDDLVEELRFARRLHRLWLGEHDRATKERMFAAMHRSFVAGFSTDTIARSGWQGFDGREELNRYRSEPRDTVVLDAEGMPVLKPVCVLVHDRMLARPFLKYDEFDFARFVDYGRPFYDNNQSIDEGKEFPAAVRANRKRAKAEEKEQRARERASK